MTFVIHGATGAQGAPVVSALTAEGRSVSGLTRSTTAASAVPGARLVPVDISSVDELTEVYRGAEGVFVHLPMASPEQRQAYARNIVTAVREARPYRVVFSTSGATSGVTSGGQPVLTDDAVSAVVDGLAGSGVSHAVVAPELFLENLLLPAVVGAVRDRGVLNYPIGAGFRVSWVSHLDVADAVVALLGRPDITGVVPVGQYPAVTGPELARAFGEQLGSDVVWETITPADFRTRLAPLIGDGAAAGVEALYEATGTFPHREIEPERSAHKLLGLAPRSTSQWLAHVGL